MGTGSREENTKINEQAGQLMAKQVPPLLSFNRGEVSRHALARVDVDKLRLSAERQENWLPYVLGPMMLRPGLQYIGAVSGDKENRLIPFVFSNSDVALIELTPNLMRVWTVTDDNETLVTRGGVTTAIVNGDLFITGWMGSDQRHHERRERPHCQ